MENELILDEVPIEELLISAEDVKLLVQQQSSPIEKPLATVERNTLLTIIAALCNDSCINHKKRGAAPQIAKLTKEIDAPVSEDAILKALQKIPNALETRMK